MYTLYLSQTLQIRLNVLAAAQQEYLTLFRIVYECILRPRSALDK